MVWAALVCRAKSLRTDATHVLAYSLTHSLTHPLTHSLTHSLSHLLTDSLTHPPTYSQYSHVNLVPISHAVNQATVYVLHSSAYNVPPHPPAATKLSLPQGKWSLHPVDIDGMAILDPTTTLEVCTRLRIRSI